MANYTRLRALAVRLIAKNGRDISMIQFPRTPADAGKPWLGPAEGSDLTVTVRGVVIEYDVDEIDNELVKVGDKRALIAAQAFEESDSPAPPDLEKFDRLQDGSDIWNVERVTIIAPGPSRVLYDVQIRK